MPNLLLTCWILIWLFLMRCGERLCFRCVCFANFNRWTLSVQVSDRQSYLVVSLVLCLSLGLMLCLQCCRSSSPNPTTNSTALPKSHHYPSPKRLVSHTHLIITIYIYYSYLWGHLSATLRSVVMMPPHTVLWFSVWRQHVGSLPYFNC